MNIDDTTEISRESYQHGYRVLRAGFEPNGDMVLYTGFVPYLDGGTQWHSSSIRASHLQDLADTITARLRWEREQAAH